MYVSYKSKVCPVQGREKVVVYYQEHTFIYSKPNYTIVQSKPCKMFAATLQPSWPSRP